MSYRSINIGVLSPVNLRNIKINIASQFLIILFYLIINKAQAACEPIDHRDRLPPTRNQAGFGWCWAFTTADILSFETGANISPLAIGIETQRDDPHRIRYQEGIGGTLSRGLMLFRHLNVLEPNHNYDFDRGERTHKIVSRTLDRNLVLCLEEDFPQIAYDGPFERFNHHRSRVLLNHIEQSIRSGNPDDRRWLAPPPATCTELSEFMERSFPSSNFESLTQTLTSLGRREDPLSAIYEHVCQRRIHLPEGLNAAVTIRDSEDGNIIESLDEQLNRSPAGISYNADFLYDQDTTSTEANHASSIVARRENPNTGQCEYLLRNSWGTGCEDYDQRYECEEGNIWISSDLLQHITQTIYGMRGP